MRWLRGYRASTPGSYPVGNKRIPGVRGFRGFIPRGEYRGRVPTYPRDKDRLTTPRNQRTTPGTPEPLYSQQYQRHNYGVFEIVPPVPTPDLKRDITLYWLLIR